MQNGQFSCSFGEIDDGLYRCGTRAMERTLKILASSYLKVKIIAEGYQGILFKSAHSNISFNLLFFMNKHENVGK